jgi:hypothetical protein
VLPQERKNFVRHAGYVYQDENASVGRKPDEKGNARALLYQEWTRADRRCAAVEAFCPGVPSTCSRWRRRVSAPQIAIDERRRGPRRRWDRGRG